ncbi:DUF4303 domain-containing protein [bacterium]|nr:DUF4303 domain-containing protein [bacterium]
MNTNDLESWLKSDDPDLIATIVADIKHHVATIRSAGQTFYGYAVLPDDYLAAYEPGSISVAFNRESDISPEHRKDAESYPYYRFSVDEWEHYVHEGFHATNFQLKSMWARFKEDASSSELERAMFDKVNNDILQALLQLKVDGTFTKDDYVIIWIPDSDYDIMTKSAKALNSPEIFEQFSAEFG